MYVITDDQGRVRVSYTGHAPQGAVEVAPPEGWDAEHQQDWRLIDGIPTHDPEPEPEPEPEVIPTPTLGERVAAVEAGQADQAGTLNDLVLYLAGEIGGVSQ